MSKYGRFHTSLVWSEGEGARLLSPGQHHELCLNSVTKRKSEHPDQVKHINT